MDAQVNSFLPLISFLIQFLVIIVGAVVVITRIEGTTKQLNLTIGHLATAIEKLTATIKDIQEDLNDHEVRIRLIEQKTFPASKVH